MLYYLVLKIFQKLIKLANPALFVKLYCNGHTFAEFCRSNLSDGDSPTNLLKIRELRKSKPSTSVFFFSRMSWKFCASFWIYSRKVLEFCRKSRKWKMKIFFQWKHVKNGIMRKQNYTAKIFYSFSKNRETEKHFLIHS